MTDFEHVMHYIISLLRKVILIYNILHPILPTYNEVNLALKQS